MPDLATHTSTGSATATVTGTRGQVLAAIRTSERPISIEDLSAQLGLHANTVRFHTDALVAAGLVEQGREQKGGKGRPKAVFAPTREGVRSGERNYQLLAAILVNHLSTSHDDPTRTAREAGRSWGRRLRQLASADEPGERSLSAVLDLFDDMGFDPDPTHDRRRILLRNCPFREVVDEHQAVVCAAHQGLVEGLLSTEAQSTESQTAEPQSTEPSSPEAQATPPTAKTLRIRVEPLVPPGICAVHLPQGDPE